jgi:hypothetical protein
MGPRKGGPSKHDNDAEAIFPQRYMGYHNCYKQYMVKLRYYVRAMASGTTIVEPQRTENLRTLVSI